MCWQEVDWATIGSYIVWAGTILLYLGRKIYVNKFRLKRDIKKLRNGEWNSEDAEAILDLFLFVLECATTLGGARSVRGLLEEAVKNNNE